VRPERRSGPDFLSVLQSLRSGKEEFSRPERYPFGRKELKHSRRQLESQFLVSFLSLLLSQPRGCVTDISLDAAEGGGILLQSVARRFGDEARTSRIGIPVVIGEVMKTRMGERAAEPVVLLVLAFFERHDQVERTIRALAGADRNDPRIRFALRRAHAA